MQFGGGESVGGGVIDPPIKSIRARGVRLDSSIIDLWSVWLYKTAVVGASLPWLFCGFLLSAANEWWQKVEGSK